MKTDRKKASIPYRSPIGLYEPPATPATPTISVTSSVETVTPAMATSWLETNSNNRPISQARVSAYVRVMLAGLWLANNQGIGFDTNGRLIDGQHRLWAIVEANIPVRLLVVRGLQPEAHTTIDRGGNRSVAEIMRREGVIPNPRDVTQWCNATARVLTNRTTAGSFEEAVAYFRAREASVRWAIDVNTDRRFRLAGIWGALIYAHGRYPRQVEEFTASLLSGAGLGERNPAFLLREWLTRLHGDGYRGGSTVSVVFLKTARAVQAHVRGEDLSALIASRNVLDFFATPVVR